MIIYLIEQFTACACVCFSCRRYDVYARRQ